MPPRPACVWNFTTWPAVLDTTAFSITAGAAFHVGRERIDADARPAQLLERLGVRADRAVARADVEKEAVGDAGEHLEDDPLVLADLGRVGRAAERLLNGQRQRLQQREVAARAIGRELLARFDAARADRHHHERAAMTNTAMSKLLRISASIVVIFFSQIAHLE